MFFQRKRRTELDGRIARDQQVLANNRAAHGELAASVGAGQVAGEMWLERHGVELAQATVIEQELATRRARALEEAITRAAYEPSQDLLERIGQRPASLLESERWDRAAGALEGYRQRYEQLPGPEASTAPNAARGSTPPRRPCRWPQTRRPPSICPTWAQSSTSSRRRLTKSKAGCAGRPSRRGVGRLARPAASRRRSRNGSARWGVMWKGPNEALQVRRAPVVACGR